jgi:hypothetical protein
MSAADAKSQSEWKVILISTCGANDRPDLLQRMLDSVAQSEVQLSGRIKLFLLIQKCSEELLGNLAVSAPSFVKSYCYPHQISISAARNRLLSQALDEPVLWQRMIVAFPDDDAWYPSGTIETIVKEFESDERLGLWFCRYSSAPVSAATLGASSVRQPSLGETIRYASANTTFLRGDLVNRIRKFDETLGVGSENGSGEDTDFAIKAFALAPRTIYLDNVAVGHRDFNSILRARYYRGSLITLGRYTGVIKGMYKQFIRKLAVGSYLTLSGQLAPRQYVSAVRAALASLGTAKVP